MIQVLSKDKNYAVIGVSKDEEKYGYKVFFDLLSSGYQVYGFNPKLDELLNNKIYDSIFDFKEKLDVIIFVVPKVVSRNLVKKIIENYKDKKPLLWFQPGSEDEIALNLAKKHGFNTVYNSCIMIEKNKSDFSFKL